MDSLPVSTYNAGMTIESDSASNRLGRLILWTLCLTVVVQCVGNWLWMTQIEETPLLHWMLDPAGATPRAAPGVAGVWLPAPVWAGARFEL